MPPIKSLLAQSHQPLIPVRVRVDNFGPSSPWICIRLCLNHSACSVIAVGISSVACPPLSSHPKGSVTPVTPTRTHQHTQEPQEHTYSQLQPLISLSHSSLCTPLHFSLTQLARQRVRLGRQVRSQDSRSRQFWRQPQTAPTLSGAPCMTRQPKAASLLDAHSECDPRHGSPP